MRRLLVTAVQPGSSRGYSWGKRVNAHRTCALISIRIGHLYTELPNKHVMTSSGDAELDLPADQIRSVLEEYPVRLALVFGSHARQEASERSDIDIAVEFDDAPSGGSRYNELLLGLGADLEMALSRSVDVLDLHRVDPSLGRQILEDGIVLLGSRDRLEEFATLLEERETDEKSPLARFDAALERLDEHLA